VLRDNDAPGGPEITFTPLDQYGSDLAPHPELSALYENKEFEQVLGRRAELLDHLSGLDAIAVLGVSGFYTQLWSLQSSLERKPSYELQVADLEFLQLLFLQSSSDPAGERPTPDDLPPLWSEVRLQYFSEMINESLDMLDPSKAQLVGRLRSHSAYYRNPYGLNFYTQMLTSISEKLDATRSYAKSGRFVAFSGLVIAIFERINKRFEEVHNQLAAIHDPRANLPVLAQSISESCPQSKTLYSAKFEPALSRGELELLCHNMLELSLWQIFRFTESDIVALSPGHDYDPMADLSHCAIEFSKGAALLPTDIWYKPFILHNGDFYLFSPYTVLSFPFHLLLSLRGGFDSPLKTKLEEVRGKFLENEAATLFKECFPNAAIFENVYWYEESGDRIETDLLVLLDDRLIILEAKGAIIPDKLRAGNYNRTKSFLRDTFAHGNLQANRFISRLKSCPELFLYDERGNVLTCLRQSEVIEIIPIVLTIEQLGPIANARKLLELAEISNASLFQAMPLMISELTYILRLLPSKIFRIHYLSRRSLVYRERSVLGDEMDLFALYVMFGFSADIFSDDVLIWALGASYSIKNYFDSEGALKFSQSSTLANTSYFSRVLSLLSGRHGSDHLSAALAILDTPAPRQNDFEQALRKLRLGAVGDRRKREDCRMVIKSGVVSLVVVGTAWRAIGDEEKRQAHRQLLRDTINESMVEEGVLIDLQGGVSKLPFSSILYGRADVRSDHD